MPAVVAVCCFAAFAVGFAFARPAALLLLPLVFAGVYLIDGDVDAPRWAPAAQAALAIGVSVGLGWAARAMLPAPGSRER